MTALRAFLTIGLAAFLLLLVAPPMFQTPPSVSTGVHLIQTGAVVQPNVVRVDQGLRRTARAYAQVMCSAASLSATTRCS